MLENRMCEMRSTSLKVFQCEGINVVNVNRSSLVNNNLLRQQLRNTRLGSMQAAGADMLGQFLADDLLFKRHATPPPIVDPNNEN